MPTHGLDPDHHYPPAHPPLAWPVLTDGRLTLRAWQADDAPVLVEAGADADMRSWTTIVAFDEATASRWIEATRVATDVSVCFAVCEAEQVVGGVSLIGVDWDGSLGEVGYWLLSTARGRGLAQSALALLGPWAIDTLGLSILELHIDVENTPSARVAQATGYHLVERAQPFSLPDGSLIHIDVWQQGPGARVPLT